MARKLIAVVFCGSLLLAGCQQQPSKNAGGAGTTESGRPIDPANPPAQSVSPPSPPRAPSPAPPSASANDVRPVLAPPTLVPAAEKGEKGARNVLLSWARAVELRKFDDAWSHLSEADRKKWSKAEWRAIFADLGQITVIVPAGEMEGAAGSLYYTAPFTITGSDPSGRPVRYTGEATLRRVNDVDGATANQLRWHFDRLTLDWTH